MYEISNFRRITWTSINSYCRGIPANLEIKVEDINKEMFKRQGGYGRGRRMQIEKDTVEIVSGVRNGYTLGSPITMVVTNDDFTHWRKLWEQLQ